MLIEGISIFLLTLVIGLVVMWVLKGQKEENIVQRPLGRMQLGGQAEDPDDPETTKTDDKVIGRKEAAKIAKKEEKKKQQEARKAYIEEKNRKDEEKHQQWLKRQEDEELEEKKEEERLKKIEEERKKKEEEEYAPWKDLIAVESIGEDIQEENFTLDKFLEYIKIRKVVMIEDLANAFNLDGKTTVNRLNELEKSGILTGIIDDRGKFIYITDEEFLGFKKYLEARGRVSRLELCNEGNRLIRLNPTAEDKIKIDAEEKIAAEKEVEKE